MAQTQTSTADAEEKVDTAPSETPAEDGLLDSGTLSEQEKEEAGTLLQAMDTMSDLGLVKVSLAGLAVLHERAIKFLNEKAQEEEDEEE